MFRACVLPWGGRSSRARWRQSPRTAAAEKAAEAESARSVAAVQAGVGAALSAPRTGKVSKPCAFFVAGRCAFGDKCVYSHDNFRDQEAAEDVGLEEEEEEEEGSGGAERLGYGEEEEEEEEDEWAAREAALDEAERIQAGRRVTGIQGSDNVQSGVSCSVGNGRADVNL